MPECNGVWVDLIEEKKILNVGEIKKIREFVKHGGVEYEKLRKTEFGLSDLERKLEDEALRLDMRIDKAYRRARLFNMLGF